MTRVHQTIAQLLLPTLLLTGYGRAYYRMPDVLLGHWESDGDYGILIEVRKDRVIFTMDGNRTQTCFVEHVRVEREFFGGGGETNVFASL